MALNSRFLSRALFRSRTCDRCLSSAAFAAAHENPNDAQTEGEPQSGKRFIHPFKGIGTWNTKDDLIKELSAQILYKDEHIVILNKPYGLLNYGFASSRKDRAIRGALYFGTAAPDRFNLQNCLPALEETCKMENLRIVKTIDRYMSGPVVLAAPSGVKMVEKCWGRAPVCRSYMAVTVGTPNPPKRDTFPFVVKMEKVKTNRDEVELRPVVTMEFPGRQQKRRDQDLVLFRCKYSTLSSSPDAAVLHLDVSKASKNSIRLIMAHHLAPLLGDDIFGARVKKVLGVAIPVPVHNSASEGPQELPAKLRSRLKVPWAKPGSIPLHLHCVSVRLPGYHGAGNDLEIFAPPPAHVLFTLKQLGLITDSGILRMIQSL